MCWCLLVYVGVSKASLLSLPVHLIRLLGQGFYASDYYAVGAPPALYFDVPPKSGDIV